MIQVSLRRIALVMALVCGLTPLWLQAEDAPAKFHWENDEAAGTADLKWGDQPVLRYMYAYDPSTPERLHDTYKVYHHVYGPGTGAQITKGPGGQFTHHRGLFIGWNKTGFEGKSADFWHCTNGAHLRHAKFIELEGDAGTGKFAAEVHWNDGDGKPVIIETRRITVKKVPVTRKQKEAEEGTPDFGWQIDWQTELASQRGTITLNGDRQHAGFQYRAAQEVAESKGARYIRPASFPDKPDAIEVGDAGDPPAHINLNWFAMTYEVEGKHYTAEYFEDPSLPKPSLYSERPYGRFGAFFKATLEQDKPLTMRYRVVVTTGETPSRETIQQRYDAFVESLKAAEQPPAESKSAE